MCVLTDIVSDGHTDTFVPDGHTDTFVSDGHMDTFVSDGHFLLHLKKRFHQLEKVYLCFDIAANYFIL